MADSSFVAAHDDSLGVDGAAYAVAGLVGVARIDRNAHFASDVLAGAFIGTTVGRAVLRLNNRKRIEWAGRPVTVAPWVGPKGWGLGVSLDYQGACIRRRALSGGQKRLP